jgi:hypothetical protein
MAQEHAKALLKGTRAELAAGKALIEAKKKKIKKAPDRLAATTAKRELVAIEAAVDFIKAKRKLLRHRIDAQAEIS